MTLDETREYLKELQDKYKEAVYDAIQAEDTWQQKTHACRELRETIKNIESLISEMKKPAV